MTKLAILALGLALAYTPVQAQQDSKPKVLALTADCGPIDKVLPFLTEEYGERPFALGSAIITLGDENQANGVLLITVNPKELTYTVNIVFEEDEMMCLLTTGDNFKPADLSNKKPKKSL